MPTVPLRKRLAGSDSYGNVWPQDGSVIEVEYEHAMDLLQIADAGFTVADQPEDITEPVPPEDLSEIAPDLAQSVDEAPARKTAARRPSAKS